MRRMLLLIALLAVSAAPVRAVEKKAIDQAVDKGVAALRKLQRPDGGWPDMAGATALAGLTLLECGFDKDDKAVKAAAANIRAAALALTDTYTLALSVLFLDRLDVKSDTSLIESMLVRLLAGQLPSGNWGYQCPPLAAAEIRRLKEETDGARVQRGSRNLSKLPAKGKRKITDLPGEIQLQLKAIAEGKVVNRDPRGDNSNTQFAMLALWVGRGYGIPAQKSLLRVDRYFRAGQNQDGGWPYTPESSSTISTATMTCAGVLGLAFGHGANLDIRKARDPKVESADVSKDANIKAGLLALGTAVGQPTGWTGARRPAVNIQPATGRTFYFLWSLERVAVAYNLETIARKDWYQWGAEILLANQKADGSWAGEFAPYGADTCFALLFLKRANFTRDLSVGLRGGKKLDTVLKAGGVGGTALKGPTKSLPLSDIGSKSRPSSEGEVGKTPVRDEKAPATGDAAQASERPRPGPGAPGEAAAARLTDDLVKAGGEQRAALLNKLRDARGAEYTEALVRVIGRLDGDDRRKARAALADRLTRMKATTLREYLKDKDVEIRRASALAAGQQDSRILIPDLICLLDDPQLLVERAAHAALKALSGRDFGPPSAANRSERAKAVAAWQAWWKKTHE